MFYNTATIYFHSTVILFYNTEWWYYSGIRAYKSFITLAPGANVIKLFRAVIHHFSIVIQSFFVLKQYYLGNYNGMAVNYDGILNIENVGLKLPC